MNFFKGSWKAFAKFNHHANIKYYIYTDPALAASAALGIVGTILLLPCFSHQHVPPPPDAHHKYHEYFDKLHSRTTDANKSITPKVYLETQKEHFGEYIRPDNMGITRISLESIKDYIRGPINK